MMTTRMLAPKKKCRAENIEPINMQFSLGVKNYDDFMNTHQCPASHTSMPRARAGTKCILIADFSGLCFAHGKGRESPDSTEAFHPLIPGRRAAHSAEQRAAAPSPVALCFPGGKVAGKESIFKKEP